MGFHHRPLAMHATQVEPPNLNHNVIYGLHLTISSISSSLDTAEQRQTPTRM
jgi:hypothetical protein